MKRKVVSLLLASVMTLSLMACGSSSSSATTAGTQSPAGTSAAATTEKATEATGTASTGTASTATGLSGHFSLFHFMEEDGAGTSKAFWNAAKKFQEEHPEMYSKYVKTSTIKESLLIRIN